MLVSNGLYVYIENNINHKNIFKYPPYLNTFELVFIL